MVTLKFFCILLTFKRPKCLQNIIVSHSVRKVTLCARSNKTACAKSSFAHVVCKICVRYAREKVILSPCGLFKRPHEDKSTFSHLYRKWLFPHSVRKVSTLRTECEKIMFDTRAKNDSLTSVIVTLVSLRRQTHTHFYRTCVENNYFKTPCSKLEFAHALIKERALN